MSTASGTAQLKTIAQRVQSYVGANGVTFNSFKGRVFIRRPSVDAPFPHVVIRKLNAATDPEVGNLREDFEIEAMCYGRSASGEEQLEALADLVQQALQTWRESSSTAGLSFSQRMRREHADVEPLPSNPEAIAIRVVAECTSWPAYITSAPN